MWDFWTGCIWCIKASSSPWLKYRNLTPLRSLGSFLSTLKVNLQMSCHEFRWDYKPKCHLVVISCFYSTHITITFDPKKTHLFQLSRVVNFPPWLRGMCTCQHTPWGSRSSGGRPTSLLKCSFSSSCGNCSTNHNDCWRMWAWLVAMATDEFQLPANEMSFNSSWW